MTTPLDFASWSFTQDYVAEDEAVALARTSAAEVGITPIAPGAGAALRFLVSVLDAKAVVEIGTGTGVSGLHILAGLRPDGVLTTVDIEAEHQRLAREAFTAAGVAANRARTITGAALDVLPRLTDHHYDLVFAGADVAEYDAYLTEALRLLRPGGVVAFDRALAGGGVADPASHDPAAVGLRELAARVAADATVVPLFLPVGDGLLLAQKKS